MTDPACVTYPWLIGTGIAIIAITLPVIFAFSRGKVSKEMCKLMHENTDKVIALIHANMTSQGALLQQTHDSIIRVEVALEKNGIIKKQ